jgi:hypothetical protein
MFRVWEMQRLLSSPTVVACPLGHANASEGQQIAG